MTSRVRRALLSVHDKTGLIPFARGLRSLGIELLSTGGTARTLTEAGVAVREVAEVTRFPEMLDGRVKTLHPAVHGGLLAVRDNPEHLRQIREQGIEPIDLLAINLYPFEATLRSRPGDDAAILEMIDIGGPAMLRSAAKNHAGVVVVADPADYPAVLEQLQRSGDVAPEVRRALAARVFSLTASYDAIIASYLERSATGAFPATLCLPLRKRADLRYGENPHQRAALYRDPLEEGPAIVEARVLQGKELSFNNILDLDAAWALVCDFQPPACAIIKHTNPAGAALGSTPAEAYRRALAADPVSAFGGIVAFNRTVDEEAAGEMAGLFLEAVAAPAFSPRAAAILGARKNLRLLETGAAGRPDGGLDFKRVWGGMLVQQRDEMTESAEEFRVVTRRAPTQQEREALVFAWTVARHVKSNAVVFARGTATAGVGAGQMSRVDAVRLGAAKAAAPPAGCVLASDAFFPFRDGVDEAARAGVTAVVQPGGSVKDAEVIAAADEHGMAMLFTGRRHFRH
ncbi:MAG TPA: bifunctional phosphoribosylaminoimidazolecarboxamide formyltransferase/IMP cyclohydrolase [Candidatus Polarisedimenticolia bacterium]|nr:bifunctional phosphoribosylaminoimidazolecarboxamide formyltransferase/IMP cyclohydrolase [Candidatus Polarisedimenticolia bacterium]